MKFGEKLKVVRRTLGLSQQELAERLDTTKQAISRYENGEREPNLRTAKAFSDKLGIDLTILADESLYFPTPEKIRNERETRGLSRTQLAELLKISENRLAMLENGECFPTVLELTALSDVFCASVDWLLGLEWRPEGADRVQNAEDASEKRLISLYRDLNPEGQEKLIDYADDLVTSGKYIKNNPSDVGQKQA